MTTKEKVDEKVSGLQEIVGELFTVASVDAVNWKVDGQNGHPFTIGTEHVAYASDHCFGRLGDDVIQKIPCKAQERRGGPKCNRPHSVHTHDTVAFLKLKRNCTNAEAREVLVKSQSFLVQNGIDGFIFVETPEKFRVES